MFRYDDDANDDPDYQQPASMSQKDDDMDDEDDKVPNKGIDLKKILRSGGNCSYFGCRIDGFEIIDSSHHPLFQQGSD